MVLAGAAGAEPPRGQADSASQRSSTPERAARNSSTCDATGRGVDGSPPCAAIIASHTGYAPPEAEHLRGVGIGDPGEGEHLPGERDGQLDDIGRSTAAQHLDRLRHLQRVAGRAAQRYGHVGEHRSRAHTVHAADLDHRLGQLPPAPEFS